jgi:mRNA interferase MazF
MNQGEIWLVDLDPTVGAEMNKTRPALIINDNRVGKLPLKIIIPITGWKEHYSIAPWMIKIEPNEENRLTKISSLDCMRGVYTTGIYPETNSLPKQQPLGC